MADSDSPTKQERRPRWRRWMFRAALLAVFLFGAVFFWQRWLESLEVRDWKDACAETDALDPSWRYEDLVSRAAALPVDRNSALQILAAASLVPTAVAAKFHDTKSKDLMRQLAARSSRLDAALQSWREAVRSEPDAVAAALRVADMPEGRMPLPPTPGYASGWSTRGIEFQKAVEAALLPNLVTQIAEGDSDGALRSARAILSASRPLLTSPLLLDNLIGISYRDMAAKGAERVIAHGEASPQALDALSRAMDQDAHRAVFLEYFRGNRAMVEETVRGYDEGRIPREELELHFGQKSSITGWRPLDDVLVHWRRSNVRRNAAARIRILNWIIERSKESPDILATHGTELSERLAALPAGAWNDFMVWKFVAGAREEEAVFRCATVAVAAERFRQNTGHWPTTLAELVPNCLSAIPPDPFDLQPLRLARRPDGIVIYSVGPNLSDDGGAIAQDQAGKRSDLGIRLWDVEYRPPAPADAKKP